MRRDLKKEVDLFVKHLAASHPAQNVFDLIDVFHKQQPDEDASHTTGNAQSQSVGQKDGHDTSRACSKRFQNPDITSLLDDDHEEDGEDPETRHGDDHEEEDVVNVSDDDEGDTMSRDEKLKEDALSSEHLLTHLPNRRHARVFLDNEFAAAGRGRMLAAVLFEVAKTGVAFYFAHFASYQVVYGSLGGVIALLFWVYVSANILLFGAEVSAEIGHVLRGEPRRGYAPDEEGDWRHSLRALLRGLVFAPSEPRR